MEFALWILKWIGILAVTLTGLVLAVYLVGQMAKGVYFILSNTCLLLWHGFYAFRNRKGYDPSNYVYSEQEQNDIIKLDQQLEAWLDEKSNLEPAFSSARRKQDGSIDRRGRGGDIEDRMSYLLSGISDARSALIKIRNAPFERARSHARHRAALWGYGISIVSGLALLPILVSFVYISQKYALQIYPIFMRLDPLVIQGSILAAGGAIGRAAFIKLRDARAQKMLDESLIISKLVEGKRTWLNGFSGSLQQRLEIIED